MCKLDPKTKFYYIKKKNIRNNIKKFYISSYIKINYMLILI